MIIHPVQVAEPMLHRAAWPLWLGLLAAAAVLAISLGGCTVFSPRTTAELDLGEGKGKISYSSTKDVDTPAFHTVVDPNGNIITVDMGAGSSLGSPVQAQNVAMANMFGAVAGAIFKAMIDAGLLVLNPALVPQSYALPSAPRQDGMVGAALARQVRGTVP